MLVILKETTRKLGSVGDVLTVKKGFARNYLIPLGKAVRATKANLAILEQEKEKLAMQQAAELEAASKLAESFSAIDVLPIYAQAERGFLFGAVNAKHIVAALSKKGIEVSQKNIVLGSPIKELGAHEVKIFLHPEVECLLRVHVLDASKERPSDAGDTLEV
ncbi:ribosomal protein L9 [Neorickettsia helminthoeca str. Oregon]|uniref:Large ribosomal subunit protein bL9 n=1 Tax=Neorickettsia helminthoeca str. Oregon TaxID=1286528 RepID=X5H301_9RICK|nr:50S ribosomal protein L9 [Neorickettsia helminthoeca]AHX11038.1 ribosomal protein L9 [Neorickettsia helminthoeca str. Oregon]